MNKQEKDELLEDAEGLKFWNTRDTDNFTRDYKQGKNDGIDAVLYLIEESDEPQKVKVPAFVAEWYEEHNGTLDCELYYITIRANSKDKNDLSDFEKWFRTSNDVYETLIKMKLYGYEVEEEPKYRVLFPIVKEKSGSKFSYLTENGMQCYGYLFESIPQLTELEIKAIDERYWAFAVPVKQVEG